MIIKIKASDIWLECGERFMVFHEHASKLRFWRETVVILRGGGWGKVGGGGGVYVPYIK